MRIPFLAIVAFGCVLSSCGGAAPSESDSESAASSFPQDCIEPENPYNDGGHAAGFKWAQEKGGTCEGNSDSFNEGCWEYYAQLERHDKCIGTRHE